MGSTSHFLKFTRYVEWWEYKLPPLLAVAYGTVIYYGHPIQEVIKPLVFLLLAIIVGAAYVSVLNDITDVKEDLKAGKSNSMASLPVGSRYAIIVFILFIGICFGFFIYPDWIGVLYYTLAYVVFSLYSIRPFRFKERGLLGIACDAMGAHLFPALLLTSNLIHIMKVEGTMEWYLAIGCWSLLYGVRGILWHQFHDRENDLKSGTNTFATEINPRTFQSVEVVLFIIELLAFLSFISFIVDGFILAAALLYLSLSILRLRIFKRTFRMIVTYPYEKYQLLLNDFYIVFLPITLLLIIGREQPIAWLILCFHLTLFPMNTITAIQDYLLSVRHLVSKFL